MNMRSVVWLKKLCSCYSLPTLLSAFLLLSISMPVTAKSEHQAKAGCPSFVKPVKGDNNDLDRDGLKDSIEAQFGADYILSDTDGDGLVDGLEVCDPNNPLDSDNDGRLDVIDQDDDNDGVPTVYELQTDTDEDGLPDYLDDDSDGDGMDDRLEVSLLQRDDDRDHIDDSFDADVTNGRDDNGDGVDDDIVLIDSDKDGIPDIRDTDLQRTEALARAKKIQNQQYINRVNKKREADAKAELKKREEEKRFNLEETPYSVSGYFYCLKNNKIMSGITNMSIKPADLASVVQSGMNGDYLWKVMDTGHYTMTFTLPDGFSVAQQHTKGRRIIKKTDRRPLIVGPGENSNQQGYLVNSMSKDWYSSFEFKMGAPGVVNNNIPLVGSMCLQQ